MLLDGVSGQGQYVGTFIAWSQFSNGWWGEGEVKFYMDGDTDHPTICGTGTEDYFGGAVGNFGDRTFSTPFLGYPLYRQDPVEVPLHGMYRWPSWTPSLQAEPEGDGAGPRLVAQPQVRAAHRRYLPRWRTGTRRRPHAPFPALPPLPDRWPRA